MLVFSVLAPAAGAYTPTSFQVRAGSALLVNLDSDDVIFQQNADASVAPTSIVKLMVAVLVAETVPDFDTTITVDKSVYAELAGQSYDIYKMQDGEIFSVAQLLNMTVLNSSNEAAYLLANYVSGSVDKFVTAMNEKAAALGMSGTHFANVTGMDAPEACTTAQDLYKLAKYYLSFPGLADIANTRLYTVGATNLTKTTRNVYNTNSLLDGNTAYYYRYANGLKNGSTTQGGRCVVASATYNDCTYICILMGCPATDENGKNDHPEFTDAAKLFHWAFTDFTYKSVVDVQQPMAEAKVKYSFSTDHVTLYPETDLQATIPSAADLSTITSEIQIDGEPIAAPIQSGEVLGTATLYYAGQPLGTVNLVARDTVEANPLLSGLGALRRLPGQTWFRVTLLAVAVLLVAVYIRHRIRKALANSKRRASRERQRKTPMLEDEDE